MPKNLNPFSPSGRYDVFGDGTPSQGQPFDMEKLSPSELLELRKYLNEFDTRRKPISYNPSAGSIHRKEAEKPWRKQSNIIIQEENVKARKELKEKRILALARQTHKGLIQNLGVCYGIPELTTIFRYAQNDRELEKNGSEIKNKNTKYASLLVAAEQYDLKRIASILGLKSKKSITVPL